MSMRPPARSPSQTISDSSSVRVMRISPNCPRWRASSATSESSVHSSGGDFSSVRLTSMPMPFARRAPIPSLDHWRSSPFPGLISGAMRALLLAALLVVALPPAAAPAETVFGGTGRDSLEVRDPGGGRLLGGGGPDRLAGSSGPDVLLGEGGGDDIAGGPGADRVDGGAGGDKLSGGPEDDVVHGGSGPDRIDGGPGADELHAGTGPDRIAAGDGDDVVYVNGGSAVAAVDCGSGSDTLYVNPYGSPGGVSNRRALQEGRFTGCEQVVEALAEADPAGGATLRAAGRGERVVGTAFGDTIEGGPGADDLLGLGGDDVLTAGGASRGSDRLDGGAGDDVLEGGDGDNRIGGGPGADAIRLRGRGINRVAAGAGDDVILALDRSQGTIDCGPGRDRVILAGKGRLRTRHCERVGRSPR